ncbi:MAG: N-acetylglucosamine-6-phosphate deacetylase [Rubripirellula sp.]|nr:N-acetylglucosamine-6-phosphate deacetylase [Rubripirellula sp.]
MSGYVDLQVNGYAGVDFNALDLTLEDFHYAMRRIREDGTSQFLPTLITAPWQEMLVKIERIAGWIENGEVPSDIVPGLHIEGPFLSPLDGFIGAHPKDAALPATESRASELLDRGRDFIRLITLAPEVDDRGAVTRLFSDRGVVVAAGHSDASLNELKQAIDQGLSLYTHLGNGCPSSLSRHDNIIQRVLSLGEHLSVSFIADGHHVPSFALRNYLNMLNDDHVIIVTDAIVLLVLVPGDTN